MNLSRIRTWIFDCDGVILDSNSVKTDAFYAVALPFGEQPARQFVEYHQAHGGISRYEKFQYFFSRILKKEDFAEDLTASLDQYGRIVQEKLLSAAETKGFREFLRSLPDTSKKFVVSGGNEGEIRDVFHRRGLDRCFDGIYGSPRDKKEIVSSLIRSRNIDEPAVFIGDSRFDYEVAREFGFDFIFISRYSEFSQWDSYFADKKDVIIADTLESLAG